MQINATVYSQHVTTSGFAQFRRTVIRNGGAIVVSAPAVGGFHVTYVSKVGA